MDIWLPWSRSAEKQDWGPWIVCYRKLSVPSVEFWGSGDAFSNSNVMEDRKKLGSSENCRNVGGGIAERLVENFLYRSLGAGVDNLINTSHAKICTLRSELVFQEGWRWRYWKLFLFFSFAQGGSPWFEVSARSSLCLIVPKYCILLVFRFICAAAFLSKNNW